MLIEVLGFLSGVSVVAVAGGLFLRHEAWRTIHSFYGRETASKPSHGNALIWPSR